MPEFCRLQVDRRLESARDVSSGSRAATWLDEPWDTWLLPDTRLLLTDTHDELSLL